MWYFGTESEGLPGVDILRVTSQASYSPEYITPSQQISSFNRFTLLVNVIKIRSIIIPRWRTAHCFLSKYFENQARYEKVVKGLHI
jgi:hypothetical protein